MNYTLATLNKQKQILLRRTDALAFDWHTLADEYARLDDDHQVEFCLMWERLLQSKNEPDDHEKETRE